MKNTHFLLAKKDTDLRKSFLGAFIAKIDGQKATSMKDFHEQIGEALNFPDYSGKNLDALDEMLNDLEWIDGRKSNFIHHKFQRLAFQRKNRR